MMTDIHRRGLMLVLSSPSGAGKTTISRKLLAEESMLDMSISATTRPPRPNETDGTDYHFMTTQAFGQMRNRGDMLEHAKVFDNHYGTPRLPVENALLAGRDVLFDIDWQGTQQLKEVAADDLVQVFILPPSVAELERRLTTRASDAPEVVTERMSRASDEISHYAEYDYIIVNEDVTESVGKVKAILQAERLKRVRQTGLSDFVSQLRSVL